MKSRVRHTVPILAVLKATSFFAGQLQAQGDVSDFSIALTQDDGTPFPFQFVRYINGAGEGCISSPELPVISYLTGKVI